MLSRDNPEHFQVFKKLRVLINFNSLFHLHNKHTPIKYRTQNDEEATVLQHELHAFTFSNACRAASLSSSLFRLASAAAAASACL
jgi:hypothetical protein